MSEVKNSSSFVQQTTYASLKPCLNNPKIHVSGRGSLWSLDGKTHNKVDYIIVNNKWKSTIASLRSFPSADVVSGNTKLRLEANLPLYLVVKAQKVSKKCGMELKPHSTKHQQHFLVKKKHDSWIRKEVIKLSEERSRVKQDKLGVLAVSPEVTRILRAFAVTPNHPLMASDPMPCIIDLKLMYICKSHVCAALH